MPFLPIKEKLFANVDEIGNTVAITSLVDIIKDDLRNNAPRFRLIEFADLGTGKPIDGVFRFKKQKFMAAVSGGRLFKITELGVVTEIPITGGSLSLNSKASLADFGSTVYICNNSKIIKWTLDAATAAPIADPDAPDNATHVAFFDQYLLAAIKGSQKFEWSDTGRPDDWLGEFASAEARPDDITGLFTAFGEIFIPGTSTLEHWTDLGDAVSPFGRLSGTMTERGVLAPDSVTLADNTFFFLDQQRRIIRLEGRAPKVISNSIDREIQALSHVSDARGFAVEGQGQTLYVLTFPTAGRTFAYNYKLDDWTEFSFWEDTVGVREAFLAQNAEFNPIWGNTLLGSRKKDGKIYETSLSVVTDAGEPLRAEIVTGRIDWNEPSKRKRSKRLRLHIKRGTSGLVGESSIFVYFRDDGKTEWSNALEGKLGPAGDEYLYIVFNNLGRYRNRQWRFIMPSVDTVLVSAEETIEVSE